MGFNSVYRCLQEVFPEIDTRILRAVALEHSRDADAAVNDVLSDVVLSVALPSSYVAQNFLIEDEDEDEGNRTLLTARPAEEEVLEPSLGPGFTVGESSKEGASRSSSSSAVDNNTGSVSISDHPDLGEGDNKWPSSQEPGRAGLGNFVTIDHTGRVLISDFPILGKAIDTWPASELFHADVGDYVTGGGGGSIGCDLISDLEVEASAEISSISPSARACYETLVFGNGSFRCDGDDAAAMGCDVTANDPQPSSFSNEGDAHLSSMTADVELIIWGEKHEEQNDVKKGTEDQVHISTESEELVSCDKIDDIVGHDHEQTTSVVLSPASDEKDGFTDRFTEQEHDLEEFGNYKANESEVSDEQYSKVDDENIDVIVLEPRNIVAELVPPSVSERDCDPPAASALDLSSRNDHSFIEMGSGSDDDFAWKGKQSGQICSTEFLDEIIEDAKNNKKNLFSVMESVMTMIKEVELQERAAELAKEEAAIGGIDILVKVEEMKEMLAHANEANGMHAGEVYGEKSILATEVRELQSRLLCLSDERDNSLDTLDEMRQTLEARLAAAEEAKKAAELEKLGKEESARKALAEQEAIMENVVQESKLLKQEAAENSKLREFLVDRGRTVDILQGEISVICQDVRLLKEQFDKRVPLSMSVLYSQTTCKLASLGSSLKSIASVSAPEEPEPSIKSPEEVRSLVSSTFDATPKLDTDEDLVKSGDKRIEDEWDIIFN